MSSVSLPAIRHILRNCAHPLRLQRRWARVHDVRFVATHRDQQQVTDRYKEKLEQKAKQEGHHDISSLKEAYKDKITEFRRKANTLAQAAKAQAESTVPPPSGIQQPPPAAPLPVQEQQQTLQSKSSSSSSNTSATASASGAGGAPGIKPLSSYVDLEKLSQLPRKEIEYLWRLRFANDSKSLCAVVPYETYTRIYKNARAHPQFILPLPRPAADDGSGDVKQNDSGFGGGEARSAADIHFLQWGFHPPAAGTTRGNGEKIVEGRTANTHVSTVLFTHLAAFKVHGAYSQPHTTVTHHLDLVDSHGIVLLHGGVVNGRGVSTDEARWLLMCLQKFYDFEGHGGGIGREKRQGLLEKFSKGDTEGFKLEELMDEAERIS